MTKSKDNKKPESKELIEAKEKYREESGRAAHHTWDVAKVLENLALLSDSDEENQPPPPDSPEKKTPLKPKHSRLFIPGSENRMEGIPGRTVMRENWTDKDTEDYKVAYKDRLRKAMKKLE